MSFFHLSLSRSTVAVLLVLPGSVMASEAVEFNPYFMSPGSQQRIDLTRFNLGLAPAGRHNVIVIVNGRRTGRAEITVKDDPVRAGNRLCVTPGTLKMMAIDTTQLSRTAQDKVTRYEKNDCLDLEALLPPGSAEFDPEEPSLLLTLPEIYLMKKPRGYVSPEEWDTGITAATLGYNLNATRNHSHGQDNDTLYGNLKSGLNVGGWFLRHNGVYTRDSEGHSDYNSINTFLQRDLPQLQGRLLIGDASTKGEQFDTLSFRGVQLANEEQMLPNSVRGYAPVVKGVARTAARVIIRQGGRVIYERTVVPGAFEITDLYPTGYGGNLDVSIKETDDSEQNFQIPYTAASNLLRPGSHHYSLTYGRIRSSQLKEMPILLEGAYRRGISNELTLYGGLQGNEYYQALQGGGAVGTFLGALSFDITHAQSRPGGSGKSMSGESYQLKYSQVVQSTGSNLSIAAWRFSTSGFTDFLTAMSVRERQEDQTVSNTMRQAKNRLMVSASQPLPAGWGQFYISAWQQSYWNDRTSDRQYQFGYTNRYRQLSYSLNMSRNQDAFGRFQNTYMLNLTLPLGGQSGFSQIGSTLTRGPGNTINEQLYASGASGEERQYSYNVTAGHTRQSEGSSNSSLVVNGSARTPYTTVSGLAGGSNNYGTWSAGVSGAMVAHSGGVTLSPYSGDTYALVEAKGAKGARMVSYPGIRVDRFGYALVPYLTAYQLNEVEISPKGLSNNVELNLTSQKVAPYSGAVVKVSYGTTVGYPALISASMVTGEPLPFGAEVFDEGGRHIGAVGQGGKVFARVPSEEGRVKVSWGSGKNQQCWIRYMLPADADVEKHNTIKFSSRCE